MKYTLAFIVAGLSWLLAGCGASPAVSLRPLYISGEKPVADPRIEGDWAAFTLGSSGVSEEAQWKVTVQSDGCYQAERQKKDSEKREEKDEKEIYRACLVRLDNKLFFDAEMGQKKVGPQMVAARDMAPGMVPVHVVGPVWVQPDFVRLARLDANWAKQEMPEESRDSSSGSLIFTGSTQQLRSTMAQHADDSAAMTAAWYLCRPGADCGLKLVEDELARGPDVPSVLDDAASFFAGRGDYDKALALARRHAELQPADATVREEVGWARLCLRDFPGARADFGVAGKLDPKDQSPDLLIGASYFLEGNYSESHKIFAKHQSSPDDAAAMLIVLDYASLTRLGRSKQAEAFLSEQMARLVASEDDQLFLLRAAGRIKDFSPHFTDEDLENGQGVLYALMRSAKGDRESARQALQETVNKVARNSPFFVAAKIELERLDTSGVKP
jgi:Flp pilus assembly protein TadD